MNALERLFASYEAKCEEVRRDLALTETKLRDFGARLGGSFPHERYMAELSALRDELRVALSATPQEGTEPMGRMAGELAGLIEALKGTQTVEAVPVRRPTAAARLERPVTARISREAELAPAEEPTPEPSDEQAGQPESSPTLERLALPPLAPKPVAHVPRDVRRKRYQKWLF